MGTTNEIDQHPVIFFDGVCNLCNSSVNFVIDRDSHGLFKFASLQSETAGKLLSGYPVDQNKLESIVLLKNDEVFTKSSAVLEITKDLPGPWKLLYYMGKIFPKGIRDWMYNGVARKRYSWFGKRDECRLPTPELKERFLDS